MINLERRAFLFKASALSAAALFPSAFLSSDRPAKRKFRICLNPGAIGVELSQQEMLDKAIEYGFEAIVPYPAQLATMRDQGFEGFLSRMKQNNITWGTANLPVQFRESALKFRGDFERLQESAHALNLAKANRMSTWIMPTHKELTYMQNFNQHKRRLKEVAKLLSDKNIRLGLEYVGPKTLMTRDKYAFIRTMAELQELIDAIDEPNVGIQLDAFHWFCAGESKQDILNLTADQIVTVDLNDAKKDKTAEEQLDWERELPMDSKVINLKDFLEALVEIGYDGPVRAEPFNSNLNKLDNEAALRKTIDAMGNAVSQID